MSAVQVEPLDVFEVPFSRSRTHAAAVEGMLSATEMIRAPHTDVEALCDAQGREWSRLMLEEHLALRASREKKVDVTGVDVTGVDGLRATASGTWRPSLAPWSFLA